MHYLGLMGVPRRYSELGETAFIPNSAHTLNAFITVVALIVGFAQLVFLFNLIWSVRHGRRPAATHGAPRRWNGRPRETPPAHGNWGSELPVVYRWAYDYSVPGARRTSSRRTSRRPLGRPERARSWSSPQYFWP